MHIEAYIQHQLSSILWKKSTSFWTPDFFKRTMQCLLPSGLSSDPNDTADLDPTTASSEPGDPEPAEPWKERVKRRATQLGKQKWWDFSTQKWAPKKCIRTFPNNPLLYPAIGFFATPTGGCYGELLLPPKKMAGAFFGQNDPWKNTW